MSKGRLLTLIAVLALAVVVLIGLGELHRSKPAPPPAVLTAAQLQAAVSGAGEPFAALHQQSSQLLPGGLPALRARIAALHGHPLVVNKWASWCEPCKEDFPLFQRAAANFSRSVAFIGIASNGSTRTDSEALLSRIPLPYPSYWDPSGRAGASLTGSAFLPVTLFVNPQGRTFVRQGAFPSLAKLEADVRRYAES